MWLFFSSRYATVAPSVLHFVINFANSEKVNVSKYTYVFYFAKNMFTYNYCKVIWDTVREFVYAYREIILQHCALNIKRSFRGLVLFRTFPPILRRYVFSYRLCSKMTLSKNLITPSLALLHSCGLYSFLNTDIWSVLHNILFNN